MDFTNERVPNQAGKPAVLLGQACCEGSRIRKQTNTDLSMLPDHVVEGFRTLIDDLASVIVNVIRLPSAGTERTTIVTRRTRLQNRVLELLEVSPNRTGPMNLTG